MALTLAQVRAQLASAASLSLERVRIERVDLPREGTLCVSAAVGARSDWYRCTPDGCAPCDPAADPELPLAERLGAAQDRESCRVLAYRPGRRLVLRVEERSGPRILKGYRRRRLAAAAGNHERLARGLEGTPLRIPRLLEIDEERSCLVLEYVEGRPLFPGRRTADAFFRLGAALQHLQERGPAEDAPRHGPEQELAVLDGWERTCRSLDVPPPAGWEAQRARLARHAPEAAPWGLVHRDLHDRQLLLASEQLVLLDADLLSNGDPLLDAGNLIAHLKLRELQGRGPADDAAVQASGRALLDGLGRDHEARFRDRLRFYQAATFLRLVLLYGLRTRWASLAPELLDLGRRCLDDA